MSINSTNPSKCSARRIPRLRVAQSNNSPSRTKQSEKKACDINFIISRYQKTGMLEHINQNRGIYGEAPAADYREALETVRKADALFKALPSSVRNRFDNDPAEFLAFCEDPANLDEARLLGLANPATTAADLTPAPSETASEPK